jgi:hypothetical protein
MGDEFDHVTTNISPTPSAAHEIDFFFTSEIAAIADPDLGEVLFRGTPWTICQSSSKPSSSDVSSTCSRVESYRGRSTRGWAFQIGR